jgi:hypothetical protein
MEINFGLGPNTRRAGPGEILKFRSVQTSTLGALSQGLSTAGS